LKKADLVAIGKVLRSQGKEGHLKVRLLEKGAPAPALSRVCLGRPGGFEEYEVEAGGLDRNSYILKLRGVDTLEGADALAGAEVFVAEDSFRSLERGAYYEFQVVGSRVVTVGGTEVGTVRDVLPAGGSNVLVVARGEDEIYVPFAEPICRRVDPAGRVIVIDPPDGLLDLNEI
jgi:16S rRNA processing protein RimM